MKFKKNVFLILYIVFFILTIVGALLCIIGKVNNAGFAVVPMLFCLIFNMLYRNSKKELEENKK